MPRLSVGLRRGDVSRHQLDANESGSLQSAEDIGIIFMPLYTVGGFIGVDVNDLASCHARFAT